MLHSTPQYPPPFPSKKIFPLTCHNQKSAWSVCRGNGVGSSGVYPGNVEDRMLKPRGSPDGRLSALRAARRQGTHHYRAHLAVRRVLDSPYTSITTCIDSVWRRVNSTSAWFASSFSVYISSFVNIVPLSSVSNRAEAPVRVEPPHNSGC